MSEKKTLTFSLMDGPFENERTVTAMRLIDIAARRGYKIHVFAYEGAAALAFAKQAAHPNAVHGHDVDEEDHPLPKDWITSLMATAKANGGEIDWINCGLCVDERGVGMRSPGPDVDRPPISGMPRKHPTEPSLLDRSKENVMAKKTLQIIDTPYRCTIEEQDDPAIWITHAMKGAGGEFTVLFRGNAVNYALKVQDASGLRFGSKEQTKPPQLPRDVAKLTEKGIDVYIVEDDAVERGLEPGDFIAGVKSVNRKGVVRLFDEHDQIWHW